MCENRDLFGLFIWDNRDLYVFLSIKIAIYTNLLHENRDLYKFGTQKKRDLLLRLIAFNRD